MNEELFKLRRTLVLSSIMIMISLFAVAVFLSGGVVIFHPLIGVFLFVVGLILFISSFSKARAFYDDPEKQSKKTDKKESDAWDGWEYLGEGCYCLARAREDRDEEIKRRAEYKAYMEKNFPNKKEEIK